VRTDYVSTLVAVCTAYCALQIIVITSHYITSVGCQGLTVYVSDMLTPAADVTSRAMRSSTRPNCDYSSSGCIVVRTLVSVGELSLSCARLLAG